MCGIAGILNIDGHPVVAETVMGMVRAMAHRGPDDSGVWTDGPIGLGHARLSILDLSSAGHQPMFDPVSGDCIVYNGEIYNFVDVRRELIARGASFRSNCDTEVILAAYREWGENCLDRLNGMFAFALLEKKSGALFLARDRIGIKPLYYYRDANRFVFASEIKALVSVPGVVREINRDALPEVIAFRYASGGQTLLRHVRELEPGHCLRLTGSAETKRKYWDVSFQRENSDRTDADWLNELDARLRESVRMQLIADVPVGCALSGGVDSSLVTALACETGTSDMKTFTIGFDQAQYDERRHAEWVAQRLGIANYSQALTNEEFLVRLAGLTWHMDEPINHPNSVGIWMLAKIARQHVTVLLSGEGGDELMGGYFRYRNCLKLRKLQRMCPPIRMLAGPIGARVRGRTGRIARELARDEDGVLIWSSAFMSSHWVQALVGPQAIEKAEAPRRSLISQCPRGDALNRHLYLDLKTYLVSLLMRIDKMCMAHSLENRVPLLDHTVVEFAGTMPTRLKVSNGMGKVALHDLVARRLGAEFFRRPKVGFGIPQSYFHGASLKVVEELITSRSFRQREWVAPGAVGRLVEAHRGGRELPVDALWILAMLELWARTFIDRPGVAVT